jgi:hypothetical protein
MKETVIIIIPTLILTFAKEYFEINVGWLCKSYTLKIKR